MTLVSVAAYLWGHGKLPLRGALGPGYLSVPGFWFGPGGVGGVGGRRAVWPPVAAAPAAAAVAALGELAEVRHAARRREEVLALGELWERFTAQVGAGRLGVL